MLPDFYLNGQRIALAALMAPAYAPPTAAPAYDAQVLAVVRAWLTGVATFPLRTSGSTGLPKEIGLTRAQLTASAARSVAALGLVPADATLVCLSVGTAGGLLGVVRALEADLPLTVIAPTSDPLAVVGADSAFATVSLVPLQLAAVLAHGATGVAWLNRMKAVLVGGAAVPVALETAVQAVAAPVYHTYAMTETASHVALRRLNGPGRTDYFSALPGVEVRLGPADALEVRADVTHHRWLTTTDRAELLGAGRFRWLGRLDDVINSGGVKVDAARVQRELEAVVSARALPHEVAVVGVADPHLGERVVAVLAGWPLPAAVLEDLRTALAARLDRYERPKTWRVRPALPRLPGGKTDRQTLRREVD